MPPIAVTWARERDVPLPPQAAKRAGPEVIIAGVTLRKGSPTSCLGNRIELALAARGKVVGWLLVRWPGE